eukprot:TRINITY_DN6956_c0_g1_i1.p1 TRINITY_DN6956_c0_g1~~TRINITY_DN6956_c0_g1_i1.p1  ORF type:complete len:470 (+),score=149.12 TRINITY_DN6956_c0_g1_i1:80-1411(+)
MAPPRQVASVVVCAASALLLQPAPVHAAVYTSGARCVEETKSIGFVRTTGMFDTWEQLTQGTYETRIWAASFLESGLTHSPTANGDQRFVVRSTFTLIVQHGIAVVATRVFTVTPSADELSLPFSMGSPGRISLHVRTTTGECLEVASARVLRAATPEPPPTPPPPTLPPTPVPAGAGATLPPPPVVVLPPLVPPSSSGSSGGSSRPPSGEESTPPGEVAVIVGVGIGGTVVLIALLAVWYFCGDRCCCRCRCSCPTEGTKPVRRPSSGQPYGGGGEARGRAELPSFAVDEQQHERWARWTQWVSAQRRERLEQERARLEQEDAEAAPAAPEQPAQQEPAPTGFVTADEVLAMLPHIQHGGQCCICLDDGKSPLPTPTAPYGGPSPKAGSETPSEALGWSVLPCRHGMHRMCAHNWFTASMKARRAPTCPVCRAEVWAESGAR